MVLISVPVLGPPPWVEVAKAVPGIYLPVTQPWLPCLLTLSIQNPARVYPTGMEAPVPYVPPAPPP